MASSLMTSSTHLSISTRASDQDLSSKMVICDICSVSILKKNLIRHMKRAHEQTVKSNHCCLQCNLSFSQVAVLRSHLETAHGMAPVIEKMTFPSKSKFEEWLDTLHREQNSQYFIRVSGKRGSEKFSYYSCCRSGMPIKASANLRAGKSQGSCKIGHSCTSQIVLKEMTGIGECRVTFFKTHYGHSEQVQHMRLPSSVRREIANKLACGIPVARILDSFRDNVVGDLKRADVVTRKDIHNVASSVSFTTGMICNNVNIVENAEDDIKKQIQEGINKIMETLSNNSNIDILKEMLKHINAAAALQDSTVTNIFSDEKDEEPENMLIENATSEYVAEEIAKKALESTHVSKRYMPIENVPINPKIRKLNSAPTGSKSSSDSWKKMTAKKRTDISEPLASILLKPEKAIFISSSRSDDHSYALPEENHSAYEKINN